MFQKSKINEPIDPRGKGGSPPAPAPGGRMADAPAPERRVPPPSRPAVSSAPSVIAPDLKIIGNLITDGDLQIEGTVEGDVNANTLIVGNGAQVRGEIRSNDVTVNGTVAGKIRGRKVRLTETARVDGDIVHSSIAMEEGAQFEGSIHRADDPLKDAAAPQPRPGQPGEAPGPRPMELTDRQKAAGATATT